MLRINDKAPEFSATAVWDNSFKSVSLSDMRGRYVLLLFYPADFSMVCPTELHAFSDRAQEFRNTGCEIIACSTDSQFAHIEFINQPRKTGGLGMVDFPILSDKTMSIARDYGVLNEATGFTYRGMFIIDKFGVLRQMTINDITVGRNVDEALRLVQAYQFVDDFGEVCPVNWKPGHKAMKTDYTTKKEYFQFAS